MQTTTLTITGMRDEHCLRLVTNAIQDLPGIGYLEISLETGAATIEHGTFVSAADIYQAIEDAGFGAR
ncbi:heavy-metal-associated domain-containing protein [Thauera mechernichensis]|uniref:Heavy-metal-associated domain-containing protein n=1 Tax=Thauera mechernichensis TaxID=82788 RepID=A0ABW3WB42_9RHOO|nr:MULTISPECIES: heavy-metal-associated domain-containing protein [Thauera]ENO80644.1 ATPase P [Thauera sp. 27]ENO94006.1 ATPase P [Thauera sp. 28]MDG3065749.1 heavy-metal-associated domain-containing protein [Thauera mechernichensis]WBL64605.1 heavy-metal-associated domain-containing protein [Thauera sp. WB-2]HAG73845.1 copper chaperone [Thauera sp.]